MDVYLKNSVTGELYKRQMPRLFTEYATKPDGSTDSRFGRLRWVEMERDGCEEKWD